MLVKLFKKSVYTVYFHSSRKRKKQTEVFLRQNTGSHFFCNNCWFSIHSQGLSQYTRDYLHKNNLKRKYYKTPYKLLQEMAENVRTSLFREDLLILAELCYFEAPKNPSIKNQLYLSSAFYAYNYIFERNLPPLNFFSPELNLARQLYNYSLSQLVKSAAERKVDFNVPAKMMMLKGQVCFKTINSELHWQPESYDQFFPAYDYVNKNNLLKEDKKGVHLMTGIESVSTENIVLKVINKLKISDHATIHSIIGNIKGQDIPGGTDSIVPYESSHIDYAVSEKIIKSDHKVHKKPGAILEVERILLEHLKK